MPSVAQDYKKCLSLIEHYKALGITTIHLMNGYKYNTNMSEVEFDATLPWEFVTKVKSGGSMRHNVSVDISFTAEHPDGLTFEWSYYIEDRENPFSVTGEPKIDFTNIKSVFVRLPKPAQLEMQKLLRDNVGAMLKQRQEAWEFYSKVAASAEFASAFVEALSE